MSLGDTTIGLTVTRSPTIGLQLQERATRSMRSHNTWRGFVGGGLIILAVIGASVAIIRIAERLA